MTLVPDSNILADCLTTKTSTMRNILCSVRFISTPSFYEIIRRLP